MGKGFQKLDIEQYNNIVLDFTTRSPQPQDWDDAAKSDEAQRIRNVLHQESAGEFVWINLDDWDEVLRCLEQSGVTIYPARESHTLIQDTRTSEARPSSSISEAGDVLANDLVDVVTSVATLIRDLEHRLNKKIALTPRNVKTELTSLELESGVFLEGAIFSPLWPAIVVGTIIASFAIGVFVGHIL